VVRGPDGIALRDWFAGLAMQAIIGTFTGEIDGTDGIVSDAYTFADAMLKARGVCRE
jgi:hypothetical protein